MSKKNLAKALLSAAAAVALSLTCAVPALAAEGGKNQSVANGGQFTIGKTYSVTGTAPSESFALENVTYVSSKNVAKSSDASLMPIVNATKSTTSGDVTFDVSLPSYTGVGEFVYSFNEKDGGTAGVTYDTSTYYLVVQVVNYESTAKSAPALVCNVAIHKGFATGEKVTGITNTYESGSLAVSKTVTGNMGDKNKEFSVTVTFTAANGDTLKGSAITYTDGSTPTTASVAADGKTASATITLKHGETVTFSNVPKGITYAVAENDYTTEGYDAATYSVNGNTTTTTAVPKETLDQIDIAETVKITNNKGSKVDTGVIVNNAPFIVIGAAAVAGLAVVAVRRRSSEL